MKKLCEIVDCNLDIEITGITANSKQIKPGNLFVCIEGKTFDGHNFIDQAYKMGAKAVLVEKDVDTKGPFVKVANTKKALINCCEKFYDNPASNLKIIGVTGTDGKTTTSTMIYQLLMSSVPTAYLGTNGCTFQDITVKTNNTTPIPEEFYPILSNLVNKGCKMLSMEVSSEAILAERVSKVDFEISVLTNITEDHLNVHKTMENYVAMKAKLFEQTKSSGYCILNIDDPYYEYMKERSKGKVLTYGMNKNANFSISKIKEEKDKTYFTLTFENKEYKIESPFLGKYNVYNLTAAIASCKMLGYSIEELLEKAKYLSCVLGRGERLSFGQEYTIILDYAHTANAIKQILSSITSSKKGKLISVLGSAGGREKEKRSKMGKEALSLSDHVIFTMDDPRSEDVDQIINDMLKETSLTNYERIIDRKEAIYKALSLAKKGDIVCILGKGRDSYMALKDGNVPYCDYDVIESYFKEEA